MYYLTVVKNGSDIFVRRPFKDYCDAIAACTSYYKPKTKRSVLKFTTETINGQFARSYTELNRPEQIERNDKIAKQRYAIAAKYTNAFEYADSYFFLIESEIGISDADS